MCMSLHFSLFPLSYLSCLQAHLLSAEFGKHLLEVEDLLQKHKLMEADIAIQGDKVKAITTATLQFTEEKGEALEGPLLRSLEPEHHPIAQHSSPPAWINLQALEFCSFHQLMVQERSLRDSKTLQQAGNCFGNL